MNLGNLELELSSLNKTLFSLAAIDPCSSSPIIYKSPGQNRSGTFLKVCVEAGSDRQNPPQGFSVEIEKAANRLLKTISSRFFGYSYEEEIEEPAEALQRVNDLFSKAIINFQKTSQERGLDRDLLNRCIKQMREIGRQLEKSEASLGALEAASRTSDFKIEANRFKEFCKQAKAVALCRIVDIRDIMVNQAPEDQKTLFAYASDAKLQEIYDCFDDPRQNILVTLIQSGAWNDLIEIYTSTKDESIYTLLKAAFCQRKISITELATAYIFLAPALSGHSYTIHRFEDVIYDRYSWPKAHGRWKIDDIPEHLRYFISVKSSEMTRKGKKLSELFFSAGVAGGVAYRNLSSYAMGSAAILQADSYAEGHKPIFVLGFTPREEMFKHQKMRLSDFALFDPGEAPIIHSVAPESLIPYFHDGYHLYSRKRTGILDRFDLISFAEVLNKDLDILPEYSYKDVVRFKDCEYYPSLESDATAFDNAKFILDRIVSTIADGEVFVDDQNSPQYFISNILIKNSYYCSDACSDEFLKETNLVLSKHGLTCKKDIRTNHIIQCFRDKTTENSMQ